MQLDLALLGAVITGGAEQSIIVVDAATLELHRHAVQAETVLRIHGNVPDAKRRFLAIHQRYRPPTLR